MVEYYTRAAEGEETMNINQVKDKIEGLFHTKTNPSFKSESGITIGTDRDIKRIGYCVNLTVDTVNEAISAGVDMMVTHHDAWDFVYGMKEACKDLLKKHKIGHYFVHLPLDDCNFGTNASLAKKLGSTIIERSHTYEGFDCGRICTFEEPIPFKDLVSKMSHILEEPVKAWQYGEVDIKKVGIVCGGGEGTSLAKEAFDCGCDVYITGEKVLYTLQYAKLMKKNLIIGTHTFIEMPGVEGLAKLYESTYGNIEFIKLKEDHIEVSGNFE